MTRVVATCLSRPLRALAHRPAALRLTRRGGGSCLEARARGGEWLVRMEDLDPPRVVPGAADDILRALEALRHGVGRRDRPPEHARRCLSRRAAPPARVRGGLFAVRVHAGARSPTRRRRHRWRAGLSRHLPRGSAPGKAARAWRVTRRRGVIAFDDALQGATSRTTSSGTSATSCCCAPTCLSPTSWRSWSTTPTQGITDVVRGADLLDSTPRQIFLQRLLGLPRRSIAHLPVAINTAGENFRSRPVRGADRCARARARSRRRSRFSASQRRWRALMRNPYSSGPPRTGIARASHARGRSRRRSSPSFPAGTRRSWPSTAAPRRCRCDPPRRARRAVWAPPTPRLAAGNAPRDDPVAATGDREQRCPDARRARGRIEWVLEQQPDRQPGIVPPWATAVMLS